MTKIQIALLVVFALLMSNIVIEKHMALENLKASEERNTIKERLIDDNLNMAIRYMSQKDKVKFLDEVLANTKKVYAEYDKKK